MRRPGDTTPAVVRQAHHHTAVSKQATQPAIDVNASVDAWYKDVQRRSSKDHADRFLRAVRSLVPEGELVEPDAFSHGRLLDWANALQEPVENEGFGLGPDTGRRWRVGLLNFIDHLVATDVLTTNALAKIAPPRETIPATRSAVKGRCSFLTPA